MITAPEGREAIQKVTRSYCEAGADIVCTHTYNTCDVRFSRAGPPYDTMVERIPEFLKTAVDIAVSTATAFAMEKGTDVKRPLVAAVIGPYGTAAEAGADYDYDYENLVDEPTLIHFHKRRVSVLLSGRPDILLFETMPSLKEMKAIAQMLSEWRAEETCSPLPTAWLACSCKVDAESGKCTTACGDLWEDTVKFLDSAEVFTAIGVNCTWPVYCKKLLEEGQKHTSKKWIVYPNNGSWDKDAQQWLPGEPEQFDDTICDICGLPDLNLLAVGGCCCVGPADIEAVAKSFKN